jgi:hypothetical protein
MFLRDRDEDRTPYDDGPDAHDGEALAEAAANRGGPGPEDAISDAQWAVIAARQAYYAACEAEGRAAAQAHQATEASRKAWDALQAALTRQNNPRIRACVPRPKR